MADDPARIESCYDMASWVGRLRFFFRLTSPEHMLTTQADVDRARAVIAAAAGKERKDPAELLDAKWTVAGATHSQTGALIPVPFRMGGWVPAGLWPVAGLLAVSHAAPTSGVLAGLAALHVWNQTQIGCVTYFNGAFGDGGRPSRAFWESYACAIGSAVSITFGVGAYMRLRPPKLAWVARLAPFPAVCAANIANTYFMRRAELETGLLVRRPQEQGGDGAGGGGAPVGRSKEAARQAIAETCAVRVLIPAANFIVAPLVLMALERRFEAFNFTRFPRRLLPVQVGATALAMGLVLPVSLALFPHETSIVVSDMEPLDGSSGSGEAERFHYNKGL